MPSVSLPEVLDTAQLWLTDNVVLLTAIAALATIGLFFSSVLSSCKRLIAASSSWVTLLRSKRPGDVGERPRTFRQLATVIRPFLDENRRVFSSYGPCSERNSVGPVRWDLTLWEQAKKEKILPNNRRMLRLMEDHARLVPARHKSVFEKMKLHIYAFEKHWADPHFDYSDFRFPGEFDNIIRQQAKK
jgi:hypothetical protein